MPSGSLGKRSAVFLYRLPEKEGITLGFHSSILSHVFSSSFSHCLFLPKHIFQIQMSDCLQVQSSKLITFGGQMLTDVNSANSYADRRLKHRFPIPLLFGLPQRFPPLLPQLTRRCVTCLITKKIYKLILNRKFLKCSVMAFCKEH